MARPDTKPPEELSDRQLRDRVRRANQTIDRIDRMDPSEAVRSGEANVTLGQYAAAIQTANEADEELRRRRHQSLPERLRFGRALRDSRHEPHPAQRWLDEARRYSAPELAGETLVASRLGDDDTAELERIIKKKRKIASDVEHAEPLTDDEKREWERILGTAAGDPELFQKKRRDAQANAKLDELKDQQKVATLPRQPLLTEPGSVQLPRFAVHSWLLDAGAREGDWTLSDLGLLVGVLGCFANRDATLVVGGRFEETDGGLTLVAPAGVGSDLRLFGQVAGSPLKEGSGHVRVKSALAVLARNRWFEVEETVAELRIRLGERARQLSD